MLLLNARPLKGKTSGIQDLILEEQADLACTTETWLDEAGGVGPSQHCLPGFSVQQQQARPGEWGVAVVYHDAIPLTSCLVPPFSGFEGVYLKVGAWDRTGILLLYRPPCCSTVFLPELTELVLEVMLESSRLIVLGDLLLRPTY